MNSRVVQSTLKSTNQGPKSQPKAPVSLIITIQTKTPKRDSPLLTMTITPMRQADQSHGCPARRSSS